MKNNYIKSPLNYIGGKYAILENIIPEFPKNINTFVDLFAGGLNVSVNVDANKVIANDQITYLIEMYNYLKKTDTTEIIKSINKIITKYNLSQLNNEGYNKLRDDYNRNKDSLSLFVLTCYSFNHQIRFNNSMKFNTPFGKNRSSYNESIEKNLLQFCSKIKLGNYEFLNEDFRKIDLSFLTPNDVVYCDPPYLITTGSYNDGKRGFGDWKESEDKALLELLDLLNERNIPFFLSNVFYHKGVSNDNLIEWSKKYRVIYINKSYSNCSYHLKDREAKTVEVLITNVGVTK